MKKKIINISLALLLVLCVYLSVSVSASAKPNNLPLDKATATTEYTEEGVLNGAAYKIRIPEEWNGTLIVYAHGFYTDDSLKLVTPEPPLIAPGSHGGISIEDTLLNDGYALAGSSYSVGGWAVKEGIQDTIALISHFRDTIGKPKQTILWGFSMGGTIAIDIAEKHAGLIDGVVVESSNGWPSYVGFDHFLVTQIVYDVLFGWPEVWGVVGDLKDDLDFYTEVMGVAYADLAAPTAETEIFRLFLGHSVADFYSGYSWGVLLWFVTVGGGDIESKAGGNPSQNLDIVITFSESDRAYLESIGVDVDAFLEEVNGRKIEAKKSARNYLKHYDTPTGKLKNPMIQLHSIWDGVNPCFGTPMFKDNVVNAGKGDLLLQVYTDLLYPEIPGSEDLTGHGVFSEAQYLQVLEAMEDWIETGDKPDDFTGPNFIPNPYGP